MQKFTTKIVNMMKSEKLYQTQGGPIILSQVVIMLSFLYFFSLSMYESVMLLKKFHKACNEMGRK